MYFGRWACVSATLLYVTISLNCLYKIYEESLVFMLSFPTAGEATRVEVDITFNSVGPVNDIDMASVDTYF